MNLLQFKLDFGDPWWFLVDVTIKNREINYLEIYMCCMYNGKEVRQLLRGEHSLYHDQEVLERADDEMHQYYYELERDM